MTSRVLDKQAYDVRGVRQLSHAQLTATLNRMRAGGSTDHQCTLYHLLWIREQSYA